MTSAPLAPVIPSSAVRAVRQRARSAAGRPLPLARPAAVPSTPADVVYGIGRIDASAGSLTGPSPAHWAGAAAATG